MPQTDCKPQNKPAITPPNRFVFDYFMAKTEKANKKLTKIDKKNGKTKNNKVMQNAKMPIGKPMP